MNSVALHGRKREIQNALDRTLMTSSFSSGPEDLVKRLC